MRRSTKDIDSQTYDLLDEKTTATFAGVDALIKLNDINSAKTVIQNIVDSLRVLKFEVSGFPDKDVNQRKRIFMDYAKGAMVCGRAASCLEEHDDLSAIKYFEMAIGFWDSAWFELDLLMNEWEILLPELIDDEFDFDYSCSYAYRIAQAHNRLGQWKEVILAVEQSVKLSGEKSIYEMELIADAYHNLGEYDKCIQEYTQLYEFYYNEDELEMQLRVTCKKVTVAEEFSKYQDALSFYDDLSEYYYRLDGKGGIVEYNKACLHVEIGELGEALVVFHKARREFVKHERHCSSDILKCDEAINKVYSYIVSGLDSSDIKITPYDISILM